MSAVPTFHSLQVVQLRTEGLNGKAITLHVPEALRKTFAFKPGQYMVVRATIAGKSCQRSYSVCSTPERLYTTGDIEIGVRAVPGGVFSVWATTELEATEVVAACGRAALRGCQFHPEKSGRLGLQWLAEWLRC